MSSCSVSYLVDKSCVLFQIEWSAYLYTFVGVIAIVCFFVQVSQGIHLLQLGDKILDIVEVDAADHQLGQGRESNEVFSDEVRDVCKVPVGMSDTCIPAVYPYLLPCV